ncbi:sensor histidine kinase [Paracrocinitomix mangrovi]|uniref:sensor histidine kinase n=1 Tax=Paracrocinitomix mangrovi TaxID=2862509 RepID=UPI001C8EC545|nr:sensor histidine kinase [Paracrocinitomix mangrovi]UKN01786.1 sensor histidine kinase [Paracrocinitomix mangrovi]
MGLFSIPHSSYQDQYKKAGFRLTWKICLFLSLAMIFLSSVLFFFNLDLFYSSFISSIILLVMVGVLYKSRKYEIIAVSFGVIGTLSAQLTLFLLKDEYHFVDILWMTVISLYVFFSLGRLWGFIILMANIAGSAIYVLYFLNENLKLVHQLDEVSRISIAFNLLLCGIFIYFLISEYLKTIEFAESSFRNVNAELKIKNKEVELQNEEKSVMLKEIHHRVKNNLQVITSLLRLQSNEIKDENLNDKFNEAIQRIMAMALIHEKMYQSDDLARIDLEGYLRTLAQELIESYSVSKPINLHVNCEIEYIQPKSLVSIALMFNELISNSLKHAFEEKEEGKIEIRILKISEHQVEIVYKDNGNWKKPVSDSTFGVSLISDLSVQLDGTYTLDTSVGTTYDFIFEYENIG